MDIEQQATADQRISIRTMAVSTAALIAGQDVYLMGEHHGILTVQDAHGTEHLVMPGDLLGEHEYCEHAYGVCAVYS